MVAGVLVLAVVLAGCGPRREPAATADAGAAASRAAIAIAIADLVLVTGLVGARTRRPHGALAGLDPAVPGPGRVAHDARQDGRRDGQSSRR